MNLNAKLTQYAQEHLLRFDAELTPAERSELHQQLDKVDFAQLARLTSGADTGLNWTELAQRAEAPPAVRLDRQHAQCSSDEALAEGKQALRSGRVGMILVAGGQGTRLGFDQPKGMFPIGPLSQRTLFQMHCDRLLAVMKRFGTSIPMYVMTSPATDAQTRAYFQQQARCGLNADQLVIFCQGTMPAVDAKTGKALLASKHSLALSPDGHGGLIEALDKHGCLKHALQRGIDLLYYAQVDNPLAELCDAELIGYHVLSGSQLTTQVVKKRFAKEKVGNVVRIDGKVQIIEYSDLPDRAAEQCDASGQLKLWAGNIAVHVFDRKFLEAVVTSQDGLPFHRAAKPVPFVDDSGRLVEPKEANGIKFERFVFDLLPLAERAFVVEGDAAKVFAPVKNANGASLDTPAHTQAALMAMHREWLQLARVQVPAHIRVEIHPDWALDADEVKAKISPGLAFHADTFLR